MTSEPALNDVEDIGISTPDAQAIKQLLLGVVAKTVVVTDDGSVHELALDVIAAFQAIDDAVFTRAERTKTHTEGGYFAMNSNQTTPS